jgi:membrane-associated phospholipid phosphatase
MSAETPTAHHPLRRPFVVYLFLALLFLGLFAVWTSLVIGDVFDAWDLHLATACQAHGDEHPHCRDVMVVITELGGVRANFVVAVGGAIWMWWHHRRRFAIAWCLIALLAGLLIEGLKVEVGRDRPEQALRDRHIHQVTKSYPSGHATSSVVAYGMLGFALLPIIRGRPRKLLFSAAMALLVLLIGSSRIYLRAHWFSDVAGGFLLGLAYTAVCLTIYLWRRRWAAHRNPV